MKERRVGVELVFAVSPYLILIKLSKPFSFATLIYLKHRSAFSPLDLLRTIIQRPFP